MVSDEAVVVIGSGPSGAAAAAQLVARGVDVVVLDAGHRAPNGWVVRAAGNTLYRRYDRSLYSRDRLADDSGPGVRWFSSLALGGLSNYWTSAVPRFAPDDFVDGARIGECYRWPVTYDDLAPWYAQAERALVVTAGPSIRGIPDSAARYHCDLSGDWRDIAVANEPDGEALGPIPMAKGRPWMLARRATEFSSYHCVVEPLERAGRLRLVRGAHVSRLVWSSRKGRVDQVVHVDANGTEYVVPCSAVVLAAGTIDSTVIVLRSRSDDFPDGLGNAHGLVGRYLHDHPREWWLSITGRPLSAPPHPVYMARSAFEDSEPLMATSLTIGLASPRDRLKTFCRGRTDRFGVQVLGTMVPKPAVGVELADPDDPDPRRGRPRIRLAYDESEVANLLAGRERFREMLAAADITLELPGPFEELNPGSSVHYGGTLRMHGDQRYGVVDAWNRIHDAPNVLVADMSCFTTGPEKNPTLTSMALAMRAADRLASDLGHSTTPMVEPTAATSRWRLRASDLASRKGGRG